MTKLPLLLLCGCAGDVANGFLLPAYSSCWAHSLAYFESNISVNMYRIRSPVKYLHRSTGKHTHAVSVLPPYAHSTSLREARRDDLSGKEVMLPPAIPSIIADVVTAANETTGGWVLRYADLAPYSEHHWAGLAFLATNALYTWVGFALFDEGQTLFSILVEVAGFISTYYHWQQLRNSGGKPINRAAVTALLIDYVVATITIVLYLISVTQVGFSGSSGAIETATKSMIIAIVGVVCLVSSWRYEYGAPYMLLHGAWHILSALAAKVLFPTAMI